MRVLLNLLLAALWSIPVQATESQELLDSINAIRVAGCSGFPGAVEGFRRNAILDRVALVWSKGRRLQDALDLAEYRAADSISKHIGGIENAGEAEVILQEGYCDVLSNPALTEIGLVIDQKSIWLVFASPGELPPESNLRAALRILDEVNVARASGRYCGSTFFAAAMPLALNSKLTLAAQRHALDMANTGRARHRGSSGTLVAERVTALGYVWQTVGENISSGPSTPSQAVHAWLASSGHCANIMNPKFTAMGAAYATNDRLGRTVFWAQVFATPQD